METFFALLDFCVGNTPVTGELPAKRPETQILNFFLWSAPEPTSKQWRRRWFEAPSRSLWHYCNEIHEYRNNQIVGDTTDYRSLVIRCIVVHDIISATVKILVVDKTNITGIRNWYISRIIIAFYNHTYDAHSYLTDWNFLFYSIQK